MSIESLMGKVAAKIGSVKDKTWEKIEDVNSSLDMQAQYRFVCAVAKDEGVEYQRAVDMCTPHSEYWVPKYSLGYKMQSPHVTVMLATEKGKRAFKQDLLPEELELFENEVESLNFGEMLKEERKRQKKEKKEKKREERKRSFGLQVKSAKGQK